MLSEILYDESINDLEGILKMEKWEKRDKKRDSKKKFKDFKNNVKSINLLADVITKPVSKKKYRKNKLDVDMT
jgi:hypothetical protein|tara:strand:+ start:1151 stop:1369 length:219 start_codon:yes stop_codon:yes gene_type:complete